MELGGRVSRCASPWGWCRGSMGQGAGLRTSRQGAAALLSQVWGPRALCKRPRLQVTVHAAPEGSLGCFVRARGPQPQACPRIPRPLCWGTFRVSVRGQREGWRSPRRGRGRQARASRRCPEPSSPLLYGLFRGAHVGSRSQLPAGGPAGPDVSPRSRLPMVGGRRSSARLSALHTDRALPGHLSREVPCFPRAPTSPRQEDPLGASAP